MGTDAPPPRVGLILDFDGTILDTEDSIFRSWAELWDHHGQRLDRSDWQQNIGTDDSFDPWAELEVRLGRPLDPALAHRRRLRRDELQANRPRSGVMAWLAQAEDAGLPVGIASSSPSRWVEGHLERLGIRDRFSCVVCRTDTVPAKPEPDCYRLACQHLAADPARSVAVEDSPHGVAAAVGAGLFTVAVPHPLTGDLDLSAADLVVASLDDLTLGDVVEMARRRRPERAG
ncbi:MAG TPA: HAD-IA family hydrolase [Acidimicrobiales bacterium]|jgi:HAD superfamily hydrolase (TIGR01509 family)|nr:HAD-IA family hydrolase [Acidimicrobiales bacterium]